MQEDFQISSWELVTIENRLQNIFLLLTACDISPADWIRLQGLRRETENCLRDALRQQCAESERPRRIAGGAR